MVLNRNPVNYFAEVEQMAYDPSNMPPGIEPSPDKMLQVIWKPVAVVRSHGALVPPSGGVVCKRSAFFFRAVSSLIPTRIDTDWEPTICRSQSTAPTEPAWPTTSAMVRCACLTTRVCAAFTFLGNNVTQSCTKACSSSHALSSSVL